VTVLVWFVPGRGGVLVLHGAGLPGGRPDQAAVWAYVARADDLAQGRRGRSRVVPASPWCGKPAVRYEATVLVTAINEWG
jgi:hypothetical protein